MFRHPERGSPDLEDRSDYCYPFATYAEALAFSQRTEGAEAPLVLIRQLDSLSTSRKIIPASIATLRRSVSPNGQWSSFAALGARRIQFLTFWLRMRLPISLIFSGVWRTDLPVPRASFGEN
jgi:hypothetical protein